MRDHLRNKITETLRKHGADELFPEDEFDCCADAVIEALELRETGYYDGRVSVTGRYERPSE